MSTGSLETGLLLHCPLEQCKVLDITAPSGGVTAGQMAKINDVVGQYMADADAGDLVGFVYHAPLIEVPCAAADTTGYDVGAKVYFDAADAEVNTSSSGNTLCGIVAKDSALGDETVWISLDGMLGIVA